MKFVDIDKLKARLRAGRFDLDEVAELASEALAAIESLQRELEEARKHLAYAIEEADGWCDESRGCDVRGPKMNAARAFLADRQQQG
jgi:exonuclease VII small subunit